MTEQRDGGVLFKVRKKLSEKGPDWESAEDGIRMGDQVFRLVMWERTSKNGATFFSVKLEPWKPRAQKPERGVDLGDEIPF